MTNNAVIGGHVRLGDGVILGGNSAVHQFCRIGRKAMIGGMTGIGRDVIPFAMVTGDRGKLRGLNVIGLKRSGCDEHTIKSVTRAYMYIFKSNDGTFEERVQKAKEKLPATRWWKSRLPLLKKLCTAAVRFWLRNNFFPRYNIPRKLHRSLRGFFLKETTMRRRPVYIAVLAIAAIALMLAVLTLYAGSRKAPAARSAASAPADVEQTLSPLAAGKNCAVFAAYSADGTVSDYVIDYLRALKEIAPNIVYVTDNPIPESEIAKLRPYVNHLIARRHGEYDWGSYKRGLRG